MSEHQPLQNIYEIHDSEKTEADTSSAEHTEKIVPATDEERADRSAAASIDPELEQQRVEKIMAARDAIDALLANQASRDAVVYEGKALEVSQRYQDAGGNEWLTLKDDTIGGGERHIMASKAEALAPVALSPQAHEAPVEPAEQSPPTETATTDLEALFAAPAITEEGRYGSTSPVSVENTAELVDAADEESAADPAVREAERILQGYQAEKQTSEAAATGAEEGQEKESVKHLVQATHESVKDALVSIQRAESRIAGGLEQTQTVLNQLNRYLDQVPTNVPFGEQISKVRFYALKAEEAVREVSVAIGKGSEAIQAPLVMIEKLTAEKDADEQAHSIAEKGKHELSAVKTSLAPEDLKRLYVELEGLQYANNRQQLLDGLNQAISLVRRRRGEQGRGGSGIKALANLERSLDSYRTDSARKLEIANF